MIGWGDCAYGLLLVAAAFGWGWVILTTLGSRPSHDSDRILAYPLAGLVFFAVIGSFLWITGGFIPLVAWILVAVGLVFLGSALAAEGRAAWSDFRQASACRPWGGILWAAAAVLVLPVLLAPDSSWDSRTLHLVLPREVAQLGALYPHVDSPHLFNFFGSHTLLGWSYLLAGEEGEIAGRTVLACLVGLGTALATRRLDRVIRPGIGLASLGLLAATPVWLLQWGTAMIDIIVFTWSGAGLALLLDQKNPEHRWQILGFFLVAMAAASKHLGILPAVGLSAVLVARAIRRWSREGLTKRVDSSTPRLATSASVAGEARITNYSLRPALRAAVFSCLCLALAAPWLGKNAAFYGTALYVGKSGADPDVMAQYRVTTHGPDETPRDEPAGGLDLLAPLTALARITSGFPWHHSLCPLLLCWLPFAFVGRRSRWVAPASLIGALSLLGFLVFIPTEEDEALARYFFNVSAPFYLLAALGWARAANASPRRQRAAWALLLILSTPTFALTALRSARRLPVIIGTQTALAYWKSRDPAAEIIDTINRTFKPGQRLYVVARRSGLLRIPRDQQVRCFQAYWAGVRSARDLATALDAWQITHVLVNDGPREVWAGLDREWILGPESPLRSWTVLAETEHVRLYARPVAAAERTGPGCGK